MRSRAVLARFLAPCAVVAFLTVLAACGGGGGGGGEVPAHPPSISNLTYAPATALQAPNGTATISGTVDFTDAGGDVASLRMTSSGGADLTVPTPQLGGIKSGTGTGAFVVSVDKVGKYTFEIWMTDSQGNASNRLSGTFEVLPATQPDHPPSLSNLRYLPSSAFQAANGTATVSATVDFADAGGDVVSLRMVSSGGVDLTVPTQGLSGIKSGTATGAFVLSVNQVGKYTFELWATDSSGKDSNRLTGTFEVLPADTTPPHRPSLANFSYSPTRVAVKRGQTATINGSADFFDSGGDIVELIITANDGVSVSVPTPSASGITSGRAQFMFEVSIDDVLDYSFEAWVNDRAGASSNRVSGTFQAFIDDTATHWYVSASFVTLSPPSMAYAVTWTGSQYVAVGVGGMISTSPDGAAWTRRKSNVVHRLTSVAWSGSQLVTVGNDSLNAPIILTSPDGQEWSVRYSVPNDHSRPLEKVTWTGSQFVAVGNELLEGRELALVLTSPDGISWTQRAKGVVPGYMHSVAAYGSTLVAVGTGPYQEPAVWTSQDGGVTWTRGVLPGAGTCCVLKDVTWGNGQFVAVGGGNAARAWNSADGVTWQASTSALANGAVSITASPSRYVATSLSGLYTSEDGMQWLEQPVSGGGVCYQAILWDGKGYIAVGADVCKSP